MSYLSLFVSLDKLVPDTILDILLNLFRRDSITLERSAFLVAKGGCVEGEVWVTHTLRASSSPILFFRFRRLRRQSWIRT